MLPFSKNLWMEIITQLYDIINSLNKKEFIVLWKNFDKTRDELMEIFYSYLNNTKPIQLKYIFITENPSVLPESILNICLMLPIKRSSVTTHKKLVNEKKSFTKNEIGNIRNIKEFVFNNAVTDIDYNKKIVSSLLNTIKNYEDFDIKILRNQIYDIFTYNLCMKTCIKDLLFSILKVFELSSSKIKKIFIEINNFYKLYNNNYRPIYHIENLIITLIKIIHDL